MTARRCVELTAVFDDGTVERWDGDEAHNKRIALKEVESRVGALWAPTITKPLRRVTVVRGAFRDAGYGEHYIMGPAVNGRLALEELASMMPDELARAADGEGPLCDFRVTVEAVPVEGER